MQDIGSAGAIHQGQVTMQYDDSSTWDLDLSCGATVRMDYPTWFPGVSVNHGCLHPDGPLAGEPVACEVTYRRLVRGSR